MSRIAAMLIVIVLLGLVIGGVLRLRRGETQLSLTSTPTNLETYIDATQVKSPQVVKLKPGAYTIRAYRDGYLPYAEQVIVQDGRRTHIHIELVRDTEYVPSEGAPAP